MNLKQSEDLLLARGTTKLCPRLSVFVLYDILAVVYCFDHYFFSIIRKYVPMSNHDFQTLMDAGTIPFVIGVTGHIDLASPEVIEVSLRDLFSEWGKEMPDTPLLLLSSLAEGADQLVVKTAVKVLGERVKWATVLPCKPDIYLNDFQTPEAQQEFLALLNTSVHTLQAIPDTEEPLDREEGFCRAGKMIVAYSNMLVSIWDGLKATNQAGVLLRGGTGYVVQTALHGALDDESTSLDPVRTIPVLQVVAKRKTTKGSEWMDGVSDEKRKQPQIFCHLPASGSEGVNNAVVACHREKTKWLYKALNTNRNHFGQVFQNIQSFNRTILSVAPNYSAETARSIDYLGLSSLENLPQSLKRDMNRFGICDVLANKKQDTYKHALHLMFAVSLLTGIMVQIYAGIRMSHLFLSLYLFGMLLAYLLYVFFKSRHLDRIYHDYRAIAEALRVHIYWHVAGIKDSVAAYFLRKQRGELEWLRIALQNWQFLDFSENVTAVGTVQQVQDTWIAGQLAYYAKACKTCLHYSKQMSRAALAFYMLSLLLAAIFLFLGEKVQFLEKYESFWVGIGPFFLAFFGYYQNKTAWSEHAESYTHAGRIFWTAQERLKGSCSDLHRREVLRKLGQESLKEHSEWVLVHRKRPPEPMR